MQVQLNSFFKSLTLIHLILCLGLVILILIVYYQNRGFMASMDPSDIFLYINPLTAALGYFLSQFLFRKQIQDIKIEENLGNKLGKYQAASIIKYALIKGPTFIAIAAYYLSGSALHLVIAITLTVYLYAQKPNRLKLKKELPLTLEEQKQFNTFHK